MRAVAALILATFLATLLGAPAAAATYAPEPSAAGVDPVLRAQAAALAPGESLVALTVHERGATAEAVAVLDRLGVPHTTLHRVGVSQVLVDASLLAALAREPSFLAFHPEEVLDLHLEESAGIARYAGVHENGTTGRDVVVLVIDTGIDSLHPDLTDRVIETAQPHDPLETGLVPDGHVQGLPANDWFGHGTHVAGIVAGTGQATAAADPNHGRFVGAAPGASIVSWAVPGLGDHDTVFQAVQGFEYALEHQERLGIRVITNSWGMSRAYDPDHPVAVASLEAYRAGMAVLFSAGNAGKPSGDVRTNMFSTAPWAVSVAAANKDGTLAGFSSRGTDPDDSGDRWDHPTITAPGVQIIAAKSRMGALQLLGPTYGPSPGDGDVPAQATHYQYASGTSMSCPMVAGVVALMLEANPALAPDQVYDLLVQTAVPMEGEYWEVGAGMVDAGAAVDAARATEGTLEAFLAGDRKYDDPADVENEPLKAHIFAPPPRAEPTPMPPATEKEAPGLPLVLVLASLAFVLVRRRR